MLPSPFSTSVRHATPNDSAAILNCLHAAFEAYRGRYTPQAFADTVLTHDTLQNRLASMSLFVAVDLSGEVVGTVGGSVTTPSASLTHAKEGHIRGMAVHPGWQGRGIAAKLLATVEAALRNHGCSRLSLDTTEPLLPAIRFYEKNGFRRSGKVSDFFGMSLFEYIKDL